jgi:hypothetical protein
LRESLSLAAAALLGAFVAMLAPACRWPHEGGTARTMASRDERLTRLGRAYLPELGRVYAAAWYEGARRLEEGWTVGAAISAVAGSWDADRVSLFDRLVTPEFAAIVPQDASRPPGLECAADRRALARAWRAFAAGLEASSR